MLLFTSSIDTCPVIFCKQQTHMYILQYITLLVTYGVDKVGTRHDIDMLQNNNKNTQELRWWFGAITFIWINGRGYAVRSVLMEYRKVYVPNLPLPLRTGTPCLQCRLRRSRHALWRWSRTACRWLTPLGARSRTHQFPPPGPGRGQAAKENVTGYITSHPVTVDVVTYITEL